MERSGTTPSSLENRSIPSIGDDTTSRWWYAVLLPTLAIGLILVLVILLDNSTEASSYLGEILTVLFTGLLVVASFLSFAALYIDADKIRDRDLNWYPRWWLYLLAGSILAVLMMHGIYDGDDEIATVLLSVNAAMTPVGLWYVYNRVKHVGFS